MKIIAHPDNIAELRRQISDRSDLSGMTAFGESVELVSQPGMSRTQKTGRYILPDGGRVKSEALRISERFVEYGPEDIPFLLFAGIISEEEEMLFYLVRDEMFRPSMELRPGLLERRTAYAKTGWF